MLIDVPTLFLATTVESAAMFLAAGLLARRSEENRRGMIWLTAAMGTLSGAFVLLLLRGSTVPPGLSIALGNAGVSAMLAMFTLAVAEFQKARVRHWLLWAPVCVAGLAGLIFPASISARTFLISALLLLQESCLVWHLVAPRSKTEGVGQFLVLLGVLLNIVMHLLRCIDLAFGGETISRISDNTFSQGMLFLTTFLSLNLCCLGYILMNKEAEDTKYRQLALRDNLTQCWNRNHLEAAAHHEMQRLRRYGNPVSLVILDIDLFKTVNDSHGHAAGDVMLRGFADTARSCIRSTDILARWGGEEFMLLLPSSGYSAAACIAERIRKEFSVRSFGGVQATVSAGYASCQSTDTWEDWFRRADDALYRAKARGRNRVEPEMPLRPPANDTNLLFLMTWRKDYRLGHPEIDSQHMHLFTQANQLQAAARQGVSAEQMESDIGDFLIGMQDHFRTEDGLLMRHDNPAANAHRVLHERLTEHAYRLFQMYSGGKLPLEVLLNFILFEVTVQHMLIADHAVAQFIAGTEAATVSA